MLEACGVDQPGSRNYVIMQDRLIEHWLAESPGFNSGISTCISSPPGTQWCVFGPVS